MGREFPTNRYAGWAVQHRANFMKESSLHTGIRKNLVLHTRLHAQPAANLWGAFSL